MARARNKILVFLLKLAVSAGSLYIVFSKTDIHGVMAMLKEIGVVFFLVASLLYVMAQYVSSWRWKLILPGDYRVGKLFSLYLIGSFFSSFLPGVIGGDVVKAYYLNKDAKKIGMTIASVFMDRYLGYLSLVTIGIVSFPFALPYFGGSIYRWIMPAIFVSFVLGSLLFFGLRIGRGFRSVSEFYNYFSELWKRKDLLLWAFILSFLIQFLNYFMVVIFAYAIGEHIPLLLLFVFLPIIITLTTVPISISGLGVREGAFVLLLGLVGVKPEVSASLSLSWFFSLFVGSLPGLFAYLRYGNKGKEGV